MAEINKIKNSKKIVSVILLCFCTLFAVMCLLGLFLFNGQVVLSFGDTAVKIELTDKITLHDNSKDKLVKKLKVTGATEGCEIGPLIMVTKSNIMFNYTIDEQKFYLSAMGRSIKKISAATYASTSGDISISNKSELMSFRTSISGSYSYMGKTVKLTDNIVLSNPWYPIADGNAFWGTFDGGGHTISNMRIVSSDDTSYKTTNDYSHGVGFFSNLGGGASVKNLALKDAYIYISKEDATFYVGTLVACAYRNVSISNCSVLNSKIILVQGSKANANAGGLLGSTKYYRGDENNVTISDCYVECDISVSTRKESDTACAGGIVGSYDSDYGKLTISNCLYKGNLTVKNMMIAVTQQDLWWQAELWVQA